MVRRRAGVSLLEVMFSIGVICVGLLGVAILIPVAGKFATDGTNADRAFRDGHNWVHEFKVRGFANPTNWVDSEGSPYYYNTGTSSFVTGANALSDGLFAWEQSFCIDPRHVAINGGTITRPNPFPKPDPSVTVICPQMQRVTLLSNNPDGSGALPQALADELFFSQDDLTFTIPTDSQLPATQFFFVDSGNNAKREYDGKVSWMATVVPMIEGNRLYREFYTLSIIVFSNRDLSMAGTSATAGNPDSERVLDVTQFYASGFNGGDVQLATSRNNPEDLKIKRGDWLMLAGNTPVVNSNAANIPLFKWYRVISAGDEPQVSGTGYTRDVTLFGANWDNNVVSSTQATIVTNVIAVYEKTIHLENTSLWTN